MAEKPEIQIVYQMTLIRGNDEQFGEIRGEINKTHNQVRIWCRTQYDLTIYEAAMVADCLNDARKALREAGYV